MDPFTVTRNEMGFTAVRVHYQADPSKDDAWVERARRLYPDPNLWAQEMEISFWVAQGARVYPEFTEVQHVAPLTHRDRKVLYRAWDFGWHAPACLVGQLDPKDRLLVLREVVGHEATTREFAETVIERCRQWYPHHSAGFEDFCDPAGQQVHASASERSEVRDVEILNTLGIYPKWQYGWSRKDGRSLVHQLLVPRTDGTPSLYVGNGTCPILLQGFLGKYVYAPKKGGQVHDEPDEGLHPWADVHAALRYLCTGLYSALGLRRFKYQPVIPDKEPAYMGYGTPLRSH